MGIQADLAAFAAMGCHGLSVITAILIGDTASIEDIQPIEPECVSDQARVVLEDMQVAAFKVGALGSVENVTAIAEIVSDYPEIPLILDPFLSSMPEQGLDSDDILMAMRELLIPQTTLLLLSAVELARIGETWRAMSNADNLLPDAARIIEAGCEFVFVTGTPSDPQVVANMLIDESGLVDTYSWQRLPGSFAGAGSALSGAVAGMLGNGLEVTEAILEAQEYTYAALTHAQRLGMGKLVPDRFFWAHETPPGQ